MTPVPVIQGAQYEIRETRTCRWNAAISVISRTCVSKENVCCEKGQLNCF